MGNLQGLRSRSKTAERNNGRRGQGARDDVASIDGHGFFLPLVFLSFSGAIPPRLICVRTIADTTCHAQLHHSRRCDTVPYLCHQIPAQPHAANEQFPLWSARNDTTITPANVVHSAALEEISQHAEAVGGSPRPRTCPH